MKRYKCIENCVETDGTVRFIKDKVYEEGSIPNTDIRFGKGVAIIVSEQKEPILVTDSTMKNWLKNFKQV